MLLYLLKSGACMAVFYFFYLFFLEKENMHVFKRFYLLAGLLLALLIPLVTFTEYINPPLTVDTATEVILGTSSPLQDQKPTDLDTLNLPLLFLAIYLLGVAFLGIRFLRNLFKVLRKIRRNEKLKQPSCTQVLLQEDVLPHTFLRYIFLNKTAFKAKEIPGEVLLHEETHVKQKHSLDILFIEFLQVILWFNPFIYLINRAIKLNHEFLADSAVLGKGVHSVSYQNTLLSYSSKKYQPVLANAINYSSFKKRFTVMKTQTSKRTLWFKSLLLLPLTTLLLVSFSTTEIKYAKVDRIIEDTYLESAQVKIEIKEDLSLWLNDSPIAVSELSQGILQITSPTGIGNTIVISASPEIDIPTDLIKQLQKELSEIGIKTIKLNTLDIYVNEFPDDKQPIVVPHESDQGGASKAQMEQYIRLAKKYNKQPLESRKIPASDLSVLERVFKLMTPIQKAHAEPFPECLPQEQEKATPEMVAEYNALAKKYNAMDKNNFRVRGSELERMHYIYDIMTQEQRKNVEPFPEIPEPPAPPQPPTPVVETAVLAEVVESPEVTESPEVVESPEVAVKAQTVVSPATRPKPALAPAPATNIKPAIAQEVVVPPSPPEPKSPIEFIEEMAQKDADFYYRGKEITAKEALLILKSSDNISIEAKHTGLKRPKVVLHDGGIEVKQD